jgi:catechol 2,3-dioxygenase-like lactoylglutathione lyase family enzyme
MTTARPPLLGIRHVALFVRDLEAAERFWVDVMGYEVEWRPDPDNVYLRGGRDNLAMHRASLPSPLPASLPGPLPAERGEGDGGGGGGGASSERLDHIGIAVAAAGDVDVWAAHLAGRGVALKTQPRTHRDGSRSLYFHGPENLLVQIIHHVPMTDAG